MIMRSWVNKTIDKEVPFKVLCQEHAKMFSNNKLNFNSLQAKSNYFIISPNKVFINIDSEQTKTLSKLSRISKYNRTEASK